MLSKKQEFLLQKVQKPARYIGGEVNSVVKDKSKIKFRYAFCFPDNYEEAAGFEQHLNGMIRSIRGGDYFHPDDALLSACLRDFADFDDSQLRKLHDLLHESRRQDLKHVLLQYVEGHAAEGDEVAQALIKQSLAAVPVKRTRH